MTDAAVSKAVSLKTYAPVSPKDLSSPSVRTFERLPPSRRWLAGTLSALPTLPCNHAVRQVLKTFREAEEGSIETLKRVLDRGQIATAQGRYSSLLLLSADHYDT